MPVYIYRSKQCKVARYIITHFRFLCNFWTHKMFLSVAEFLIGCIIDIIIQLICTVLSMFQIMLILMHKAQ